MSEVRADPSSDPREATHRLSTTAEKIADLRRRREQAQHPGSEQAVARQRAKGKRTARQRIELVLDPGSFTELDQFVRHRAAGLSARPYGDGVVTGTGTVDGRPVAVFSQDFTVFGGALGEAFGTKILKVMEHAMTVGCPVIGINDGAGGRIQEGAAAQALYGEIFHRNVAASGLIPQISLIMGPCAGGAVYSPAITDFTVMVEGNAHMFITGPDVIRATTGEEVGIDELGGAIAHNSRSGCAHYAATGEEDAVGYVQELLSHLPSNNLAESPVYDTRPPQRVTEDDRYLDRLVPDAANEPYDMRAVIARIVDDGDFLEVQPLFAPSMIVGFGRVEGRSVGVVANQPSRLAGCLDIDASEKAARFVRTCDAFNVPVVTLVDAPGFLPGTGQEWNGIIRRGAKLIYAYAEATVPLVTVVTRKAYGGAYVVMGSKHLHADISLAWPTARIAVMGAKGAVEILHRQELKSAGDPGAARDRLAAEYEAELENPYHAAERGYVDRVIAPSETRLAVADALRTLRNKRVAPLPKKHGNIPL